MNVRSKQFLLLMLYPPCYSDKFEDTKCLIRSCKSTKDRKYNGQKKRKSEKTNTGQQTTTQKLNIERHEVE